MPQNCESSNTSRHRVLSPNVYPNSKRVPRCTIYARNNEQCCVHSPSACCVRCIRKHVQCNLVNVKSASRNADIRLCRKKIGSRLRKINRDIQELFRLEEERRSDERMEKPVACEVREVGKPVICEVEEPPTKQDARHCEEKLFVDRIPAWLQDTASAQAFHPFYAFAPFSKDLKPWPWSSSDPVADLERLFQTNPFKY